MSIRWKRLNRVQQTCQYWIAKKLRHGHPVDLSPHDSRNDKGIEMADVIGRQEESPVVLRVFGAQYANARDRAEQKLHEQSGCAVGQ
jgi:hypothetical protein